MKAGSASARAQAALALAEVDSRAAVAALAEALADPDLEVRAAAGLALASLRDPASSALLAGIAAGWDDPALELCRRAALRTLVALRSQEAAVALARALATLPPERRLGLEEHSALLAVAYAEPAGVAAPRVVRALVALLEHEDDVTGDRAAELLGLFPSESHGPLARALRRASAPDVRARAARALGACRNAAAVTALVAALEDPAPEVSVAAARSLRRMRDPASAAAAPGAAG